MGNGGDRSTIGLSHGSIHFSYVSQCCLVCYGQRRARLAFCSGFHSSWIHVCKFGHAGHCWKALEHALRYDGSPYYYMVRAGRRPESLPAETVSLGIYILFCYRESPSRRLCQQCTIERPSHILSCLPVCRCFGFAGYTGFDQRRSRPWYRSRYQIPYSHQFLVGPEQRR